jgi:signal transduction histidine kinase
MAAPQVLVIDDEPRNLNLIEALLAPLGVEALRANGGREGLEMFRAHTVDLVLLDVMMPEIDGLTVLAEIRRLTPPGERVPVVLVTALGAREDRLRGLEAGADDFLTKPLDPTELRCRVRTFLALRAAQRSLKARAAELEALQRAKAELTSLVVHDLKNPLAAIGSNLRWIASHWNSARTGEKDLREAFDDAQSGSARLLTLVTGLIDVEKAESGQLTPAPKPIALPALCEGVARRHRQQADDLEVQLAYEAPAGLEASIDGELVTRVMENLVENALRHAGAKGRVSIEARRLGGAVELVVANTGAPIPEDLRGRIFDKHVSTERRARGVNLGLGLYFCRLAATAHGGEIAYEPNDAWANRFVVRVPDSSAPRAETPRSAFVD